MAALRDPSVDSDVDELDMDTPVQLQPPAGESVWKKAPTKIVTPNASAGPSVSKKPPAKKAAPRKPRKASASFESERIDRLEAELSALRDVVYGGPNTAVDAEMAAFEASFISEVYARRLPPGALPVRRWFRAAVPVNTRCHLLWDDNSPKLTVSFSDAAPGAAHALELDLREMVSVNYTDPDDTRNHPVVALRGAQGKTQMQITLGLDACDADWSGTRYSELVAWFQTQLGEINGVDVFCCRYYVTQSMWATAVREANEEEHAPEALKHPIDSAHPQKIFGVTFGPKSHLQLDPTTKYLPVKAWYLRRRLSQVEEAYLVWPVSGQVCIVSGAGDNCAGRVEELDIETTECAWFVDPKETHADKIFVLQTAELEPAGASTSSSTGQTMIKFNSASAKWANSTYDVFVSWIKGKVDRYAVFLGKIGDVRWEAATKFSALTVTNTRVAVESLGEQTCAFNNERHQPHQQITVGAETLTERQGEKTSASNRGRFEPCQRTVDHSNIAVDVLLANKLDNTMSMTPKNPVTATQRNGRCLPIKAWHLGRKLFDEPYHLIWADGGNLTIRSGKDPNVKAKHSEVIDMAFAHRVWFVQPNEAYSDKVFVLETHETSSGKNAEDRKPFGAKFPELFKLGSKHSDGHVVIKFDSQSPAWVDPVYAQFIGWLKAKVDARETLTLRGKTGDDKWEAVNHLVTKAAEARIRRENRDSLSTRRVNSPALTEIPRPDNWSPSSRLKRRHSPGGFTSPYPRAQGSRALYDASFTPTTPKNGSILPKNACNRNAPRPEKRVKVESPTPSSEKNVRRSLNSNAFWPDRDHVDIIFVDD